VSHYGRWNDIIDDFMACGCDVGQVDPVARRWARVFHVRVKNQRAWGDFNYEDIQACVPWIDLDWVRGTEVCMITKDETLPG